jgi:hypothetical protein
MKNGICVGILLLVAALVAGCGGGGGGGSSSGAASPGTVKAVMKTTALSPAAATVGAISATISFPDGVYAKTDASGAVVEVITMANSTLPAGTVIQVPDYLPAATGHTGSIKFTILNADGFNATEAVTISLLIRSGTLPKAADFALVNFVAKDLNGADVTTLKPTLSATVQ